MMIVAGPNPGSGPFQDEGSEITPLPRVEICQTKKDEILLIKAMELIVTIFACRGMVLPVA